MARRICRPRRDCVCLAEKAADDWHDSVQVWTKRGKCAPAHVPPSRYKGRVIGTEFQVSFRYRRHHSPRLGPVPCPPPRRASRSAPPRVALTQASWAGGESHRPLFCSFDLELASRLANAPEAELLFFRSATALDERHVEMIDQNTAIERLA
jgi:hypothetical protein